MFEKFSNLDVDSAGGGGEYTVQVRISCYFLLAVLTDIYYLVHRMDLDGRTESRSGLQVPMDPF